MGAPWDPIPVYNNSGEDIPAFAVVQLTEDHTDGAVNVVKPTVNGVRYVLVNGPAAIPTGGTGQAFASPRVVVAYDAAAGTPVVGDEWGSVANSWLLGAVPGGFLVFGVKGGGVLNALRQGTGTGEAGGADCTGRGWWGQLRSDSQTCFRVTVASVGTGACACADDAYNSTAGFLSDAWYADDNINICAVADFTIKITKPGGVPTMTLTPTGTAGVEMEVTARCYGDGWAEFTFPGDISGEPNCTAEPIEEGCDADNGFVIRAECIEPPWWCVDTDAGTGTVLDCVQSCTEPANAISGPYDAESECSTVCQCLAWDAAWNGQNFWFCTSDTGECFGVRNCTQLNADPGSSVCICEGPFATEGDCTAVCEANSATGCPASTPLTPGQYGHWSISGSGGSLGLLNKWEYAVSPSTTYSFEYDLTTTGTAILSVSVDGHAETLVTISGNDNESGSIPFTTGAGEDLVCVRVTFQSGTGSYSADALFRVTT